MANILTKIPKFRRCVLQNFPFIEQDFDALTDYQLLCKVVEYLNRVIASQNELIESTETFTKSMTSAFNQLQTAFNQLHSFVDNYFANLDVQEEINNKLDQMAEDGELQRIIAEYLKTQVIYDTTLDMIADASNLVDGVRVETLGYRTVDDNGAAFFVIRNTGTADGKGVIDLENGLYAHMIYKHDFVTPEMFGAYGDGVNDHNDSDAIQYAINTGKTVEFAPKTYICYSLTVDTPSVLHGNGATLKKPELDIAPYNKNVSEMNWIRLLSVNDDCTLTEFTFDNNCFTMWQVSDGYAQQQSSSVIVKNDTKKIKFNISDCHFKNSASDGLHIVNNIIAEINNCTSEDCFRGGFVSTGYGSEINLNGWNSMVKTTGVHDGFDVEVDSNSSIDPTTYILNISNVVMDYDLDIKIPSGGKGNLTNITMRPFNQTTTMGCALACVNGVLNVTNSVLRMGKIDSVQTFIHEDGCINIDNCTIIGNDSYPCFQITQYQETSYNSKFNLTNSNVSGLNCIKVGNFCGSIIVDGCNISCSADFIVAYRGANPQVSGGLILENSSIKYVGRFMNLVKTQYAPNGKSVFYFSNLNLEGSEDTGMYCAGKPDVYFNNLVMASGYVKVKENAGAVPYFYGHGRLIIVNSVSDLTFEGWVEGDDIAIAKDTGTRYRYISGTTWKAI